MLQSLDDIVKRLPHFLEDVDAFVAELGIDVTGLVSDHIAIRFDDAKDVDLLLKNLESHGKVISSAKVNGRTIFVFKLSEPLEYGAYSIPCIELPYPKPNRHYPADDIEHIEFVLPTNDIEYFEERFHDAFPDIPGDVLKRYEYEMDTPEAGEQIPNPTVSLRKHPGLSVKFHATSLEVIVRTG